MGAIFSAKNAYKKWGKQMTTKQWKTRIKKSCVDVGTYKKSFDATITILADILARRDLMIEKYVEEGQEPIVEYTNKAGATNLDKNKLLATIEKHEEMAIKYLSEMGLTSKGLKSMGGSLEKKEEKSSFEKLFADLGI